MENGGGATAAPTGCYKCGRPGHWSRDCPSNPNPNSNPNEDASTKSTPFRSFKNGAGGGGGASRPPLQKPTEKPKKAPRTRPKLTPDLLLSDDGIGFVLRHFPRAFKYRGRGHEVRDLGNLVGLYAEWHAHLIPYYSFNQFVHKVEQVGSSKRVKLTMKDLRDRVANGGDPTKVHESLVEHDISNHEQDAAMNSEEPTLVQQEASLQTNRDSTDDVQDELFNEIYQRATAEEEPSNLNVETDVAAAEKHAPNRTPNPDNSSSKNIQFSEEQRARIEANRLMALERRAARFRSSSQAHTPTS